MSGIGSAHKFDRSTLDGAIAMRINKPESRAGAKTRQTIYAGTTTILFLNDYLFVLWVV